MQGALAENPFYVLGLTPAATAMEIEREGHKLLGMLELGLAGADRYDTPLGPQPRDAEKIRNAMAELRDPDRRLVHELWAGLPADAVVELGDPEAFADDKRAFAAGWADALGALGWSR